MKMLSLFVHLNDAQLSSRHLSVYSRPIFLYMKDDWRHQTGSWRWLIGQKLIFAVQVIVPEESELIGGRHLLGPIITYRLLSGFAGATAGFLDTAMVAGLPVGQLHMLSHGPGGFNLYLLREYSSGRPWWDSSAGPRMAEISLPWAAVPVFSPLLSSGPCLRLGHLVADGTSAWTVTVSERKS